MCSFKNVSDLLQTSLNMFIYDGWNTARQMVSFWGFLLFFTVQPHLVSLSTDISSLFTVVWNKVLPYCTPKRESTGELIRTTTEVIHDSTVSHCFFVFSSVSCHQNSYCGCFVWHLLNELQLHARLFQTSFILHIKQWWNFKWRSASCSWSLSQKALYPNRVQLWFSTTDSSWYKKDEVIIFGSCKTSYG